MRFFPIISLLLIISSCNKLKLSPVDSIFIGDYEWAYSELPNYEYFTYSETSDRYGFRITGNSKILFFKNGIQTSKYKVGHLGSTETTSFSTSEPSVVYKLKNKSHYYYIYFSQDKDTAYLQNIPTCHTNIYIKKK